MQSPPDNDMLDPLKFLLGVLLVEDVIIIALVSLLFDWAPTAHMARTRYLEPDAKTNPTPLCVILFLPVLWPAYNVPKLLENTPLDAGLKLVAPVKLE